MDDILSKDIIKEWGLEALPKDKQTNMVDRIGRMIYQAILVKALDILSEEEQNEFDTLLNENTTTPQDVLAFLKSKIPTFDQLVLEERNSIKEELSVPA